MKKVVNKAAMASLLLAGALAIVGNSVSTYAKSKGNGKSQTINTEVVTEGTKWNGERRSKTSGWSTVRAPKGYVFIENSEEREEMIHVYSAAGSDNRVDIEFGDYVEIIPGSGIEQPREVRVRSHARSPSGKHGARGWTRAYVTVKMTKYKK